MEPGRREQKGRQQHRQTETMVGVPRRTIERKVLCIDMEIKRLIEEGADIVAGDIAWLDIETAAIREAACHNRVVWSISSRPAMSLMQHPKARRAAHHEQGERAGPGAHVETH